MKTQSPALKAVLEKEYALARAELEAAQGELEEHRVHLNQAVKRRDTCAALVTELATLMSLGEVQAEAIEAVKDEAIKELVATLPGNVIQNPTGFPEGSTLKVIHGHDIPAFLRKRIAAQSPKLDDRNIEGADSLFDNLPPLPMVDTSLVPLADPSFQARQDAEASEARTMTHAEIAEFQAINARAPIGREGVVLKGEEATMYQPHPGYLVEEAATHDNSVQITSIPSVDKATEIRMLTPKPDMGLLGRLMHKAFPTRGTPA